MKVRGWFALAVVGLALAQTGCAATAPPQVLAIDSRYEQLDLGSLGEVVCDLSFQPGPFDQTGNEFRRQLSLADDGLVPEVKQTLKDQGFIVTSEALGSHGNVVRFDGPNSMTAGISYVSPDDAGDVIPFDGSKNCTVPAEGLTIVSLVLPK
ncbi:hypothetical protein IFT90_15400 [Frigoribacterium sp. CFBP 8766]|uniref:hypothetical protein n=1 Tax=Frigoribacterium sp. CFBP 8766 TaxID=2775273 RepID=UPI00177BCD83|nr:hypothetical protein [Frigoribacterium sp. CFBP 8766]MBD8585940.1 hypothetical protein [Frigoribacterium sp. CFBP 8766]